MFAGTASRSTTFTASCIADVLHRDGVAQRLAGEQDVRVAGQIGGDLLHPEDRRRHDRHSRRIFVAGDSRIGRAVDVRVIAQGEDRAIREAERRLIGDDRAVGEGRLQRDVELDQDLAVGRQVQVTNVDDAGAFGAARAAGGADVGAGRERDERQRAGREIRLCVERIQIVKDSEIAERLIGRAEAQRIAQPVARRGRCRRGSRRSSDPRRSSRRNIPRAPPSRCGRPRGPAMPAVPLVNVRV